MFHFNGELHRKIVHDGLHTAIIDPERWDRIQTQLQEGASRLRCKPGVNRKSLLCGKLFDETGDRLTPSHAKTRKGVRLRYYISHCLVTNSRETHLDAWRLPAPELETRCAELIRSMLRDNALVTRILPKSRAEEISRLRLQLLELSNAQEIENFLCLVERIEVTPGKIQITLNGTTLTQKLGLAEGATENDELMQSFPFQLRKRGVETKLILADSSTGIDETLIRNLARAHGWFEHLKAGKTFAEIAQTENTSPRRVQQMIELAFLAPDIVRDILDGKQPLGFTSKWCSRHSEPSRYGSLGLRAVHLSLFLSTTSRMLTISLCFQ